MAELTEVEFAGRKVMVPKGGYYDRFRSNPDLDEVAKDPAAGNIDYFRRIPKVMVPSRIGPTWAPNFYYRTGNVQALMLAPLKALRSMLPTPLEPLHALPGHGLVALTFFSYAVCDNDPYNEMSVAIVIRRPGARGPHALELLASVRRQSFFAHVLALPVDTEIARVRGVYGYQLPKWLTDIRLDISSSGVAASIAATDGTPDVTLTAPVPAFHRIPSQSRLSTNTSIGLVDGEWRQTQFVTNPIEFAQVLFPRGVKLSRAGGPISQLLDGLAVGAILRLDVVKDAQMVLYLPRPLQALPAV
ncbi:MAG: acetoacetate decarboxylase family protein [Proteobacteria bacterium]|nr:acetoacetate decarboxylase family protein [Pseudomonadota bacterium]